MDRKIIFGLLMVFLSSCAAEPVALKVDYLAGNTTYAPQPVSSILQTAPSGPYISIARLTASGAPGITQAQVIGALQKKAQALGANAIILEDQSQTSPSEDVTYNPAGGQYAIIAPQTEVKFSCLAIVTQ